MCASYKFYVTAPKGNNYEPDPAFAAIFHLGENGKMDVYFSYYFVRINQKRCNHITVRRALQGVVLYKIDEKILDNSTIDLERIPQSSLPDRDPSSRGAGSNKSSDILHFFWICADSDIFREKT